MDDGRAAHALHDAARFFEQRGVGDTDGEILSACIFVDAEDLNFIATPALAVHGGEDLRFALLHLVHMSDGIARIGKLRGDRR